MRKKLLMRVTCLLVLAAAVFTSCRKEILAPEEFPKAITVGDAKKWVEGNPVAQTVELDWSKAKNQNENGTAVINVPITREDRLSLIRNSTHKAVLAPLTLGSVEARGNSTDNAESNPNFSSGHPPAILFVKDSADKVKGYMYNFVPAADNKEDGSDGLWTGKLYQWNLKSDTLLVMEFNKNQIIKRSLIAPKKTAATATSFAKIATLRPDNHIASIWSWLGNILSDIWDALNWIGFYLGIPGAYNNVLEEYRTWDIDWGAQNTMQYTVSSIDSGPYNSYLISGGSGYGIPSVSAVDALLLKIGSQNVNMAQYLENNLSVVTSMNDYLDTQGSTPFNLGFVYWAISQLMLDPNLTTSDLLENMTQYHIDNFTETLDYTEGGYDETSYSAFDPQQSAWPTVNTFVPINKFVGWLTPGVPQNCLDYAKKTLNKMGYQISGWGAPGQTFQVFTAANGVNSTQFANGLSYLKHAITSGIPVIVGIDFDPSGYARGNLDLTTEHFVVIVGMGSDSNGKFFRFYDNATTGWLEGTSPDNKLYYNSSTNKLVGSTAVTRYTTKPYTVTQIRKSKPL